MQENSANFPRVCCSTHELQKEPILCQDATELDALVSTMKDLMVERTIF